MAKRIPISVAKRIADDHDLAQVIVAAWDKKAAVTHVVTYGKSVEECEQAAAGGNAVKKALGWPESLCNEEPFRVKALKKRIEELEGYEAKYAAILERCRSTPGRCFCGVHVTEMA